MKILRVGLLTLFCLCLVACSTLERKRAKLSHKNAKVIEPLSIPTNLAFTSIYSYYPVASPKSAQKLKPVDLLPPGAPKNSLLNQ